MKNLEYFGAKGDGITDDTNAVKQAIKMQGGFTVSRFKTYLVKETINIKYGAVITGDKTSAILFDVVGDGFRHYSGFTSFQFVNIVHARTEEYNGMFAIRSDDNATGHLDINQCSSKGFTNGFKADNLLGSFTASNNIIQELKGNVSGSGYGILCACESFRISNNSIFGNRSNDNGRHGIYLAATANNGSVTYNAVYHICGEGIVMYAMEHQDGVRDISVAFNTVDNCGERYDQGGIAIYGKVYDINITKNKITNCGGNGLHVDAYNVYRPYSIVSCQNEIINSGYSGIKVIGAETFQSFNDIVHNSSLSAPQVHSNITIMCDYYSQNTSVSKECGAIRFINLTSTCDPDTSRSPIQINQSEPIPTDVIVYETTLDNTNFLTGPEYIQI